MSAPNGPSPTSPASTASAAGGRVVRMHLSPSRSSSALQPRFVDDEPNNSNAHETTNDSYTAAALSAASAAISATASASAAPSAAPAAPAGPLSTTPAALAPAPNGGVTMLTSTEPIVPASPISANASIPTTAEAAPAAPAPLATEVPSPSSAIPSSGALASALRDLLGVVKPDLLPSTPSSLDGVLSALSALSFEDKCAFFARACSTAKEDDSHGDALWRAALAYFLDARSGSQHDAVCRWLYESYWQASGKLGHDESLSSLPSAHLFVLSLLPAILFQMLLRHFPSASGSGSVPDSASYAGLFAVCLAVYNTERLLAARAGPGKAAGILTPAPLPVEVQRLEKEVRGLDLGEVASAALRAPKVSSLPALSDPSSPRLGVALAVLLRKVCAESGKMRPAARESALLLAFLLCGESLSSLPSGSAFSWPSGWAPPSLSLRFDLPSHVWSEVLGLLLLSLESKPTNGPAAGAELRTPARREMALQALRSLHCRAIEELRPEILLQTTCILEQEELRERRMQQQ